MSCTGICVLHIFSVQQFFEVLAKITLYQKAAANYHLTSDAAVKHWLANIQSYSDKERCVCARARVCVCVCVCVCMHARAIYIVPLTM